MKIQNKFVELIKQGKKTIEIRKLNSIDKLGKKRVAFSHTSHKDGTISDNIIYDNTNGLIIEPMIIDDLPGCNCSSELVFCQCSNHGFKLAIKGYQRIKVSHLLYQIEYFYSDQLDEDSFHNLIHDDYFNGLRDNKTGLFDGYLKDEEYCIIYFINKEETFKANGGNDEKTNKIKR